MTKLSFNFEKPFDEVEINGDKYKLYYDDENLKKYQSQANNYKDNVNKYLAIQDKVYELSEEEAKDLEEQGVKMLEDFITTFYGDNSFKNLYEASGKSMINFMPLIEFTLNWLSSKTPEINEEKKNYYTKKSKK